MKKIKYLLLFTMTIFQLRVSGQLSQDILKKSTHYFTLNENGDLIGEGASIIKNRISESQFFLIGEQHNIQKIEYFMHALIPILKNNNFTNYVTEIGPNAANKLKQLDKQNIMLGDFNTDYSAFVGAAPFGFFGTKEEEITLKKIKEFNIDLLGIDFENYNSYIFLIDEIYKNSNKNKKIESLYTEVRRLMILEYERDKKGYSPILAKNILESEKFIIFLKEANNENNNLLIRELKKSLLINREKGFFFYG